MIVIPLVCSLAAAGPPDIQADPPSLRVVTVVNPPTKTWAVKGSGQATKLPAGAAYVFVVTFERRSPTAAGWTPVTRTALPDTSQGTTDVFNTDWVPVAQPFADGEEYRFRIDGAYIPPGGGLRDLKLFGGKLSAVVTYGTPVQRPADNDK